ncbi:MAG: DUF4439 domain-containing protein [Actinobacteria bacterium]|nr:DUF4439 domain-containing protein [Actinomycetota bacterium]
MTTSPTAPAPEVLASALAAEYAAVYAYGVVGAHVPDDRRGYVASALSSHRAARDWLRERITAAGGEPPPAAGAYEVPAVDDPTAAAELAAAVELATVPRWSAVAGVVDRIDRPYCTSTAQAAAVRAVTWGAGSEPFPGTRPTSGG